MTGREAMRIMRRRPNKLFLMAQTSYAGHAIKVLHRNHGARKGTKRAMAMEAIFNCKTSDEALAKLAKMGADPSYLMFALGGYDGKHKRLIELVPEAR